MVLSENYHECNHITFIKIFLFNDFILFFYFYFYFFFEKMGPPCGCQKVGSVVRSNNCITRESGFLARARDKGDIIEPCPL